MKVHKTIENYWAFGHFEANIDPLKDENLKDFFVSYGDLDPSKLFSERELD